MKLNMQRTRVEPQLQFCARAFVESLLHRVKIHDIPVIFVCKRQRWHLLFRKKGMVFTDVS